MFYYNHGIDFKDKQVANKIFDIYANKDDTLGSRVLSVMLKCSRDRIKRIMAKYDITARTKRRSYKYAGKADNIFNNLLRTDINLEDYEIVFSDIFEFRLSDSSKVYRTSSNHPNTTLGFLNSSIK